MGRWLRICTGRNRLSAVATGPAQAGAAMLQTPDDILLPSIRKGGYGLFGRTFFLLAALLLVSILAWLQTLRVFELEPRAVQTAQQIAVRPT